MTLLLNHITNNNVAAFLKNPAQSILIDGAKGSGKGTLAVSIATGLLQISHLRTENHPYIKQIRPNEHDAIGIDEIRDTLRFLNLKVPSNSPINRVVMILDADYMTLESQNALLKILEEPPDKTVFILTASNIFLLLPTILSRMQRLSVLPVKQADAVNYFSKQGFSKDQILKAWHISLGLIGMMSAYLLEGATHPLVDANNLARNLMKQSTFDRLCVVDKLSKDPNLASNLLYVLMQMAEVSIKASKTSSNKWKKIIKLAYDSQLMLNQGSQLKLILTNLMLQI